MPLAPQNVPRLAYYFEVLLKICLFLCLFSKKICFNIGTFSQKNTFLIEEFCNEFDVIQACKKKQVLAFQLVMQILVPEFKFALLTKRPKQVFSK